MFSYIYKLLSRKSTKKSIVEQLLEFSGEDYPFLPLPEPKVKSDDYKELTFSNFFPETFEVPENLILSKNIFESFILAKTSPVENYEKQVRFWKKYAYDRMSEIMENARTNPYDMDSISACPYLSVEILNEYNNVKYNWEIVTRNIFITNRDILNNPDLPWDEISLYNHRNLPKGFYQYKGIKYLREFNSEESFLIKSSKYDTFLSPIEPREYPVKEDEIINDEEVSTALQLIKGTSPEYFVSSSKTFIKEVEKIITEMIKTNGTFILDDFVFPIGYFDDEKEEIDDEDVFSIPEPTEDDPYSVRNAIKSIKDKNLSRYSNEGKFYFSKIGLSVQYLVKNRTEYLELLNSGEITCHYINPVCKCVFFEIEDFYKYNKNFASDISDCSFSNVMLTSGKLTLEYYLEHQDIDWNIEDLVKCLPIEYVIRNLLFYPDRLKHRSKLIDDYYTDVSELREKILYKDKRLLSLFVSREDVISNEYEILYQYPMIEWKLNDYNDTYLQLNKFKPMITIYKINYESIHNKINPFLYNFNTLSWDYIISSQGIKDFCESFEKTIDFDEFETKTNEEKKDVILNFVKMNREIMIFFADIIPSSFICKNKKTKWIAPYYVNIDRLFKSYIEETGSNEGFFLLLTMFVNESFNNYDVSITTIITKQVKQLFSKLIKDMYENTEDKSYVYEFFVRNSILLDYFDKLFNKQNKLVDFEFPNTTIGTYVKIAEIFTFEDIANSKYPNIGIIDKYIKSRM